MNKLLILSLLALSYQTASAQLVTESFGSGANAFTMDFVTIGNPNNAADTTGSPNPVGSVSYTFNIGKYEVSRDLINKANNGGGLGLTLADIYGGNGGGYGGNDNNSPATGISLNEAARFVNWLNISKGYQAAYNFTSTGSNTDITTWSDEHSSGANKYRHKDAYFFLPSEDEWYKAAYGSPNGTWYNYPTGSNIAPAAAPGGTTEGTAVFGGSTTGVSRLAEINSAGGLSGFGTMGQGGNAYEWVETSSDLLNDSGREYRTGRGGSWVSNSDQLEATYRSTGQDPMAEMWDTGFRVASVPEPSSLSLLALGGVVVALRRRR